MKKILFLLVATMVFTACNDEPLDQDVINDGNTIGDGGATPSNDPLALNAYSFNINSEIPVFGTVIVNTDFLFNSSNHVNTTTVASTFFGQSVTENVTYTRDNSNRIIGYKSMSSGTVTNETSVTYTDTQISNIVYNSVGNDEDDYTYNFTYSGNTITRTQVGSNISTVFSLNNNILIKKESFDGTTSIKTEILDYDGLGNCISSTITGIDASSLSFNFDTNANPLKVAFDDQYQLFFLNDSYEDEVGSTLAQFASPNNWMGITTPDATVVFTINYDDDNRIIKRTGNYDLGDGALVQQAETFSFVN